VWLKNIESMMGNSLKDRMFVCYEDMDLDIPKTPEESAPYRRFMDSPESYTRTVDADILIDWVCKFPGQCVYTCQQIWFTQKVESIFESAKERKEVLKAQAKYISDKSKIWNRADSYQSFEVSNEGDVQEIP
jgi:hypothetical protein